MRKRPPGAAVRAVQSLDMNCSYCGKSLEAGATQCDNCGAPVVAAPSKAPGKEAGGILGKAPGVGARVLARWGNGLWYAGAIDDERGPSRHVVFDDGDQAWVGPQDITAETDQPVGRGSKLAVGAKVMGLWTNRQWYPGTIDQRFGRVFHIIFDDGDKAWLDVERIKPKQKSLAVLVIGLVLAAAAVTLIWVAVEDDETPAGAADTRTAAPPIRPMVPLTGPTTVGSRVLAPYGEGAFYFVAEVRAVRPDGQVEVLFLDGDQGVVQASALRQENIGPGSMVGRRASRGWGDTSYGLDRSSSCVNILLKSSLVKTSGAVRDRKFSSIT